MGNTALLARIALLLTTTLLVAAKLHPSEIKCRVCISAHDLIWEEANHIEGKCRQAWLLEQAKKAPDNKEENPETTTSTEDAGSQQDEASQAERKEEQKEVEEGADEKQEVFRMDDAPVLNTEDLSARYTCSSKTGHISDVSVAYIMQTTCDNNLHHIYKLSQPGGYFRGNEYEAKTILMERSSEEQRRRVADKVKKFEEEQQQQQDALKDAAATTEGSHKRKQKSAPQLNKKRDAKSIKKACKKYVYVKEFQQEILSAVKRVNQTQDGGSRHSSYKEQRKSSLENACRHSCPYAHEERLLRDEL